MYARRLLLGEWLRKFHSVDPLLLFILHHHHLYRPEFTRGYHYGELLFVLLERRRRLVELHRYSSLSNSMEYDRYRPERHYPSAKSEIPSQITSSKYLREKSSSVFIDRLLRRTFPVSRSVGKIRSWCGEALQTHVLWNWKAQQWQWRHLSWRSEVSWRQCSSNIHFRLVSRCLVC